MVDTTFKHHAPLVLLFALATASVTVGMEPLESSLVRIKGSQRSGSGFVVAFEPGQAIVVTASHVIGVESEFEVVFEVSPGTPPFVGRSEDVIGFESDKTHGLAAFRVRGEIPAGVEAARIDTETQLQPGMTEKLVFWGYPNQANQARRMEGAFSAFEGKLLVVDRSVGEGASGGVLGLRNGVLGIVTSTEGQFTYAVRAEVLAPTLEGWGVKLIGATGRLPAVLTATIEKLKAYSEFESGIATTTEARRILESLGFTTSVGSDYVEGRGEDGFGITLWARSHGGPSVYGVRYGKHEAGWNWESTYFELVIPDAEPGVYVVETAPRDHRLARRETVTVGTDGVTRVSDRPSVFDHDVLGFCTERRLRAGELITWSNIGDC